MIKKEVLRKLISHIEKPLHWISGRGEIVLITTCRGTTITRWNDMDRAVKQKEFIDRYGCGGACSKKHLIIELNK